jgi:hypothetical protein
MHDKDNVISKIHYESIFSNIIFTKVDYNVYN